MKLPSVPGPRDVLALVDRTGDLVEQLVGVIPRVGPFMDHVENLLDEVERLVRRIERTRQGAASAIGRVEVTVARIDVLLEQLEPSLRGLQPSLARLAASTDGHEVDAIVGFVDNLPRLLQRFEGDVLPVLTTLRSVSPDIHDLLDVSRELNELLVKVPGMGRIKKKVEEEQAEEAGA